MIDTFDLELPHGIRLACRAAGPITAGARRVLFLHGFPEAAFVWDEVMQRLAPRARCVAPNLRGFERSSAPSDVSAYRAKHLVADVAAAIEALGAPLDLLVAHDWGGAVAWNLAALRPDLMQRLLIVNSPHPALFLRELRDDMAQQTASAYMNFLCRPDAEALLEENDFARLWPFFTRMGDSGAVGSEWLTPALRDRYREVWRLGLSGALNYYRASPLKPPLSGTDPIMTLEMPPALVTVRVPTTVLWGERDSALLPGLLRGLETYVPDLRLVRVPDATHWIVHEQPARVAAEIERLLA
jgi:pimeloyl-ACP methyl ester carboxylesterase